jgi:hypothetical protein
VPLTPTPPLSQAWDLLEEFEAKCGHTYYWVFKIRTDAIVLGGGDLHTLAMKFDSKVGPNPNPNPNPRSEPQP